MNRRLAFLVVAGAILAATASPHEKAARVGPGRDARVLVLSTMLAEEGLGEWGFAALVEADGHRILFDTGLGEDVVLRNARTLGVDLATVPDVVISHNHRDHTGGLVTLRREYARASPGALARAWVGQGIFLPRVPPGRWGEGLTAARREYESTGATIVELDGPREIYPGVWLTGP